MEKKTTKFDHCIYIYFFQFFPFDFCLQNFIKKITDPETVLKSSTGIEYMSNTY